MTTLGLASWEVSPERRTALVALHGEFDLLTTPPMRADYERVAGSEEPVVFDLRDVTFADSTLAHVLEDAADERRRHGHALEVRVRRESAVARMLAATGLDRSLSVLDERGAPV